MEQEELVYEVGTELKFAGDRKWWRVRCSDERFTILTRQAEFKPKGIPLYTIIDRERGVRGPCNLIGQGWDEFMTDEACAELLASLRGEAEWPVEVSYRNNVPIEVVAERSRRPSPVGQ
jgi:hypothetical protein